MFLEYFGLHEQPFGVTPDPRYLYFSATHREALASLFYGIETGCGFLALVAAPGTGKTTLMIHLLERLRISAQTVFLFQTQCNSREFLSQLLRDLEIDISHQNLAHMHESLRSVLLRNARTGRRFVLVIDEAQNLDNSVLETIRLLSDFETPQSKLMQIVLCGQPQLADKLTHPDLTQLRQRISIATRLHPLTKVETMLYVDYRLLVAGQSGPPLFSYDAIMQIAARSGGVPRNINNICFNALTLAYAKCQKQIDASIVDEVLADLDLEALSSQSKLLAAAAKDSLSSFEGLAPTDETSYREFHGAVRAAWRKDAGGHAEKLPSDPLAVRSNGKKNLPTTVSPTLASAPAVSGSQRRQEPTLTEMVSACFRTASAPTTGAALPQNTASPSTPREETGTSLLAEASTKAQGSPLEHTQPARNESPREGEKPTPVSLGKVLGLPSVAPPAGNGNGQNGNEAEPELLSVATPWLDDGRHRREPQWPKSSWATLFSAHRKPNEGDAEGRD
jgi:type II secretory pathway predicted ATPase ExeA